MGVFSGPRGNGQPSSGELAKILNAGPGGVDMSQLREFFGISQWTDLIPRRPGMSQSTLPIVTPDQALRHSAVWACLRLRADMLSTLPLNVLRRARMPDGSTIDVPAPRPPVLINPGGDRVNYLEWAYSTQVDLDRVGNTVGVISKRDGNGLPAQIDLKLSSQVSIIVRDNEIKEYRIRNERYDPVDIWHEKQFTVAGLPVGLSPVAYAALTLGRWQSVEQFATGWFGGGAVPRARLQNTAKKINAQEATIIKEAWRAAIAVGEPFVFGSDWTYDMIQADQNAAGWLDAQNASVLDVARFFGAPADLIEAIINSGTRITYANITQRHLQFLITHLRPAIRRREWALSSLTLQPRYVKLDTDDLLAMDPETRANWIKTLIEARVLAPDEAREILGKSPFTQDQVDQLLLFFPPKAASPVGAKPPGPAAVGPPDNSGEPT